MLTHQQAKSIFNSRRDKSSNRKPIANNTIIRDGGFYRPTSIGGRNPVYKEFPGAYAQASYDVVLHGTAVLTIHPDNTVTLRHGGWLTRTTASRINEYSPVRVSTAKDGGWEIHWPAHARIEFNEGMVVNQYGDLDHMAVSQ